MDNVSHKKCRLVRFPLRFSLTMLIWWILAIGQCGKDLGARGPGLAQRSFCISYGLEMSFCYFKRNLDSELT